MVTDLASSALVVLDTITNSVISAVQLDGHPEAVALSGDGELLYVADYRGGTLSASRSRRSCVTRKRLNPPGLPLPLRAFECHAHFASPCGFVVSDLAARGLAGLGSYGNCASAGELRRARGTDSTAGSERDNTMIDDNLPTTSPFTRSQAWAAAPRSGAPRRSPGCPPRS